MILYDHPLSCYAQRVKIALREKGLAFERMLPDDFGTGRRDALQLWLAGRRGRADWFGGEAFGWADAAVAPMVNRSVHNGLGPALDSPLGRWHARLRERRAVAETFAEFD